MKKKNNDFLLIAITTLVTVVVWTAFEFYRAVSKAPTPSVTLEQLESLNPELSEDVLNQIEVRKIFSEEEILTPQATVTPTTSTPIPTEPVSTDSSDIDTNP